MCIMVSLRHKIVYVQLLKSWSAQNAPIHTLCLKPFYCTFLWEFLGYQIIVKFKINYSVWILVIFIFNSFQKIS